uniref:Uncharacterized protein n=2 Tax=cellular organisms TaxID=131567 RepID=A0A7C3YHD5_9EURY
MGLPDFIFQAEENLVEKTWGGDWITNLKGLKINKRIGESWEFSTHPSRPSYVSINGKKVDLIDLVKKAKYEILGELKTDNIPILVKLLDIRTRISVQVHPSDHIAKMLGETDRGKDEAWMVIGGGRVYIGFKEDVSAEDLLDSRIIEKINKINAGHLDTFYIPAGIIHFAENVKLFEVSTNSDLTYRVYDFSGRETHIEKALKALKMKKTSLEDIRGEKGKIVTDKFEAKIVEGELEFEINTFNIILALEGSLTLKSKREVANLKKGYSCLIPAKTGRYLVEGNTQFIHVCAGEFYL